jgi:transcriptional regulator of acetoin/glycerol metabolism
MRHEGLFGLLYLEAPQADLESIAEVSGLLTEAMIAGPSRTARQSVLENYLGQTPENEIERRKLILLLDRHEWNVSRVARELGKTRSTVYHRLEALRIERRRVRRVVRMS